MSALAPTLVDAVRALSSDLSSDKVRGFVFVGHDGNERLVTFRDIALEAQRRAASLAAHGLRKGDRLALVIPDGEQFVLSFLGALFAGVIAVPIHPQPSLRNIDAYCETVAHVARASGAAMLLTTPATKPYVEPVLAQVEGLRAVLTLDDLDGGAGAAAASVSPDDAAFLQFTSGSTSRPKGVIVTHRNLAANAEAFMVHGLRRDPRVDKGVSWLPLFHDMGLIGFVVGPLFTNVPCVFLPTASFVRAPRIWLDKIHQHRGTITYAPSFAYALVAKRLRDRDVEGLDLSCLRIAGCGAEPIQAAALRDFARRLAPAKFDPRSFVPSYGMAEATLAISFVPLRGGLRTDRVEGKELTRGQASPSDANRSTEGGEGEAAVELVDCGVPFPGHELAIVDAEGHRLGERCVGEIVARGPSVTMGYFREPGLTARTFKALPGDGVGAEPWLHTGDLGYLAGGRLFVCGRKKDVIIVRGRNHYPTDIEWAVGALPNVRRGNVVAFGVKVNVQGAVADGPGEERLVVCCEGASGDAQTIREAAGTCISERFGLTPHEVVVTPLASLPRTSSGKLQRSKARQMYIDGTLARARGVDAAGEAQQAEGPPRRGVRARFLDTTREESD
jgi:fatty-acyl-CoA synthase